MSCSAALVLALALAAPSATPTQPAPDRLGEADFAPFFGDGAEGAAKAAFDAGRYDEAQGAFARSKRPEAAYLRALALLELDRHGPALAALAGLEEKLPELADRIRFLRGEALAGAGRKREALTAWAAVPDGSLLAPEARLARLRAGAELEEKDAALEAAGPLLGAPAPRDLAKTDFAAAALLAAGRLRARSPAADPATARRDLVACWADHPLAPEAADCLAAAKALPAPHGGPASPEESLRRAEALLDFNRNDGAIQLLQPLAAKLAAAEVTTFACRTRAALGRALRKERRYSEAIEQLRRVVDRCTDEPVLRQRSLAVLASATAAGGQRDEAVALYRRLAREAAGQPAASEALWQAADLLARGGRSPEALEALAAVAGDPTSERRDEARFRLAWLARRAGDLDAASAQLLAIEEERDGRDGYEHARAAYWRARLLATRADGLRAARAVWGDLAARYPTDYYGLLSRARLEAGGEGKPAPGVVPAVAPPSYDPGPLRDDPHFRAGLKLLRLGLPRAASDELTAIPAERLVGAGETPEPVLLVADLLDRAGDHRTAHHLLRQRARAALRRPPQGENLRAWRIAYPPAWRDVVRKFAPPSGVPVDLLQALMREESGLDPRAVSPAGAVGLTQLMLPTAQGVARGLKLAKPTRADLTRPEVSIRIGARFLGDLIRRFDGQVSLALAAYNAGGGAVSRWREARGGLEIDEFVEEIPVEETRGYVKRVLRSYAAYRLLYGRPDEAAASGLVHAPAKP